MYLWEITGEICDPSWWVLGSRSWTSKNQINWLNNLSPQHEHIGRKPNWHVFHWMQGHWNEEKMFLPICYTPRNVCSNHLQNDTVENFNLVIIWSGSGLWNFQNLAECLEQITLENLFLDLCVFQADNRTSQQNVSGMPLSLILHFGLAKLQAQSI